MHNIRLEGSSFFAKRRIAALLTTLLMGIGPLAMPGSAMALTGQPLAYVGTSNNTVTLIDTGDNQVVDTVPVNISPSYIAVAPDSKHAYVAGDNNGDENDVAVIETVNQTATVVATIPVPYVPAGIVASPDGTRVYVVSAFVDQTDILVSVIDTATNSIVGTFDIPELFPAGIAISPDGAKLYVPYHGGLEGFGGLAVVDTATGAEGFIGIAGSQINSFSTAAVSPDNTKVYANTTYSPPVGSSAIAIIDTSTESVATTIPPVMSVGVFSPDGKYLYGSGSGGVAVLDTTTNAVVTTIPDAAVAGLAITPDGKHLYVTDGINSVAVIDTSTNTVSATVSGVAGAGFIAIAPAPSIVLVPNVVGLTSTAASTAITSVGLVVGSVTTQSSATVAAGLVISESPAAGTSVATKSAVNIVVSSGPAVPNVIGLTQAAAAKSITGAGLVVGTVVRQSSATVAAGLVIRQSPGAGTSVAAKSPVNLVVSSGASVDEDFSRLLAATEKADISPEHLKRKLIELVNSADSLAHRDRLHEASEEIRRYERFVVDADHREISRDDKEILLSLAQHLEETLRQDHRLHPG